MIDFVSIPNKRSVAGDEAATDLWPEMGPEFVLNNFYSRFASAEGWLGEGYLAVWTREEIQSFREPNLEAYPAQYHFLHRTEVALSLGFVNEVRTLLSSPLLTLEARMTYGF